MKSAQVVRVAPSTSAAEMGSVRAQELVEVQCQDRTEPVGGSTLWDYIQYSVDGTDGLKKRGWVADHYVVTGSTDPLPGVRQGDCPAPLTRPGAAAPPPPAVIAPPPAVAPPRSECDPTPMLGGLRLGALALTPRSDRPRRVVTSRYGRKVTIQGRLTTAAGAPVAAGGVCVAVRNDAQGEPMRTQPLGVTDTEGAISYALPAGPSRRVWLIHSSRAGGITARSVLVRVRAPLTLRSSRRTLRNRQRLVLRGRLRGRPHRRHVLVEVQARRGDRWQTFGTTRTRRRGRFRFGYRFNGTFSVTRYRLRARVPAQSGYPYATGASRSVAVRVSG